MTASRAKTVLLAWELGEGLGHLPVLKAIAAALSARGWRCVFALREAAAMGAVEVLAAPHWPAPTMPKAVTRSYADILAANGFGSARDLAPMLTAWDAVFDQVKPDLLVCEHAPTAAVAAFGRIPAALVGNGFVVPPADGAEFPSYGPAEEGASQAPVFAAMREALAARGASVDALTAPFRGFRAVHAFPVLDPYRAVRKDPVLGPLEAMPATMPLPAKPALFAYSAADYALIGEITAALMDLGPSASAYFRGALGARASVLKSRGVRVFDAAPTFDDAMRTASCVFSHGGSGTASAALAAGRPQIVAPRHGEARLTGAALETLGTGITLTSFDRQSLRTAFARTGEPALRDAAARAANDAHAFLRSAMGLERTIEGLLATV